MRQVPASASTPPPIDPPRISGRYDFFAAAAAEALVFETATIGASPAGAFTGGFRAPAGPLVWIAKPAKGDGSSSSAGSAAAGVSSDLATGSAPDSASALATGGFLPLAGGLASAAGLASAGLPAGIGGS